MHHRSTARQTPCATHDIRDRPQGVKADASGLVQERESADAVRVAGFAPLAREGRHDARRQVDATNNFVVHVTLKKGIE